MQFIADEGGVIVEACYRDALAEANVESKAQRALPMRSAMRGTVGRGALYAVPTPHMRAVDADTFAFDIQPRKVCFDHVGAGSDSEALTQTLTLVNRTARSCTFRILPLAPCDATTFSVDYTAPAAIPPGLSWPVTVRCRPQPGTRCVDVEGRLVVRAAEGCCFVPLLARYMRPALRVEPCEVQFGIVARGECRQATVTLTNTGSAEADVRLAGPLLDALHAASCGTGCPLSMLPTTERLTLAPHHSRALLLKFAPRSDAGQEEEEEETDLTLRLTEQATSETRAVRVVGRTGAQPVYIETPSIDFQGCFYDELYSADVRLVNTSNTSLLVTPRLYDDCDDEAVAAAAPFRFEPPAVRVQPGSDFPMILYFAPRGVEAATMNTVLWIEVQGQATPLALRVRATLSARAPVLDTTHIDLGSVPLSEQRVCTVRVTNPADVPQWVGCVSLPSHVTVTPPAMRLLPRETFAFYVCVIPRCAGPHTHSLTLSGEYGDEKDVQITLCGTDAPLVLSESSVFLPACTMQDGQAVASTMLRNASATTQSYRIDTSRAACLQVSPSASTLAAGASAVLTVFFTPPPHAPRGLVDALWDDEEGGGVRWTRCAAAAGGCASWHATLYVLCHVERQEACSLRLAVHCCMTEQSTLSVRVLHEQESKPQKVTAVVRRGTKERANAHRASAAAAGQGEATEAALAARRVFDISAADERYVVWLPSVVHGHHSSCVFLVRNEGQAVERLWACLREPCSPFRLVHPPVSLAGGDDWDVCALGAGEEVALAVQFAPTEAGVYGDVLCVTSEGGSAMDIRLAARCTVSTFIVTTGTQVAGEGVTSAATEASQAGKDVQLAFPVTQVAQTAQRAFFVHNLSATEQEFSIVLEDADEARGAFIICPLTMRVVAEGKASCRVLFYPKADGRHRAVLNVVGGGQARRVLLSGVACGQSVYVYSSEEGQNESVPHMLSGTTHEAALCEGRSRELPCAMLLTPTRPSVSVIIGCVAGGHAVECVVQRELDECGSGETEAQSAWSIEPTRATVAPGSQCGVVVSCRHTAATPAPPPLRFAAVIDGNNAGAEGGTCYYFVCSFAPS